MAKLRPSAARIWLNCAKSAKLSELMPYTETPFTAKGTKLHLVASNILRGKYGYPTEEASPTTDFVEMTDVKSYTDFVNRLTTDVFREEGFDVFIEEKLTLADFLYEGNGIIDYCAYNADDLLVIDYKTGFVRVYPDANPQLNLYALAMLYRLEKTLNLRPDNIYLSISQPSQNNNRYIKTTRQALIDWLVAQTTKIDEAYYETGGFTVGKHCQFCPARGSCVAHLRQALTTTSNYEEEEETDG